MKVKLFNYGQMDTFIHRLSGATKLICFLILTNAVMLTYDIRVIAAVTVFSLCLVSVAKLPLKKLLPLLGYVFFFLVFNFILTYLVQPYYGCDIYGSRTVLFHLFGNYDVTAEQMYYEITKTTKYFSAIPIGFIFFLTTNPSEFASSLNRIGVPYKVCTSLSLTLRYFPEVQRDFDDVNHAQQARGIDYSKNVKLSTRLANTSKIIIPMLFSTLDRTDSITNAMELRGYGKNKRRSWYAYRAMKKEDVVALIVSVIVFAISMFMRFAVVKSMYYNPFI